MIKKYLFAIILILSVLGISKAQPCSAPTLSSTAMITATSATISWSSPVTTTQWEIVLLLENASEPDSATSPTFFAYSNPFVVTGLTPCTSYKWYIKSVCSPTEMSTWTGPQHFTTMPSGNCSFSVIIGATQDIPTSNLFANVIGGTSPYSYQWSLNGTIIQGATSNSLNVTGQPGMYNVTVTDATNAVVTANYYVEGYPIMAMNDAIIVYPNSNSIITSATSVLSNDSQGYVGAPIDPNSAGGQNGYSTVTISPINIPPGFSINPNGTINVLPGTAAGTYTISYQICAVQSPTSCSSATATITVANEGFLLNAFLDSNNNGIKDLGELPFNRGHFRYQVNNTGNANMVYPSNGTYYIQESNTSNTYDLNFVIEPQYNNFYTLSTSYNDISYIAGSSVIIYNFPVTELPYTDASVILLPNGAPPRPGFQYTNRIVYKNLGNQTIASGTIEFTKDNNVNIVSISEATAIPNTAGFTYNFTNLLPNEVRYINVTMLVPTIQTVNINDILTNSVSLTGVTGDAVASNNISNLSQIVVGSYDPNDKTESHGGKIVYSSFTSNDYLTYTIQFENTGTYQAENVRINDVLDAKLDETSVKMVHASHPYLLSRTGNTLNWNLNGIALAPSGKGQVTFQIKPKTGYAVGDIIPNTASIYFDFNPAIVTNTFNTEFVTTMSVSEFNSTEFVAYPNPTKGLINITSKNTSEIQTISITDILGKTMLKQNFASTNATIDVAHLMSGIYFLTVESNQQKSVIKVVKQ